MGDDEMSENTNGGPIPKPLNKPLTQVRGVPVDAFGGTTVDPTKNVLDLVFAAVTRIDDLIKAYLQRQDDLRGALDKRVTELAASRDAFDIRVAQQRDVFESRIEALKSGHQNQMEAVKSDFGKQIAAILAQQTEKSATLLSAQAAELAERLAVVEKNQYVTGGQMAIRDPVVTQQMDQLGRSIEAINENVMNLSRTTSTSRDVDAGAKGGQQQSFDQNTKMLLVLIGVATVVMPFLTRFIH
jgi:hypothetical protein